MTKEEKLSLKQWQRQAAEVYLYNSKNMEKNLENNGKYSSNGSSNSTDSSKKLSSVNLPETALVYYHPTFIGYLEAVWNLFKQAFCFKKRKDFILIGRKRTLSSI